MIVESYDDVIVLSGPLRTNFWEVIETAISLTLSRHPSGVIVDCSQLTEVTADGLETFHAAIDFVLEHEKARIIFAAVPEHVEEEMRHAPHVRSQMAVTDTIEEARRSLDLLDPDGDGGPKKDSKKKFNRQILTCLCPTEFDPHVLEVSLELLSDDLAKIVLLMPVVVPRALPLQAPMPEVEDEAMAFVEKAKKILDETHAPYDLRIERTRDLPTLVAEMAEETDAAHVIIGVSRQSGDYERDAHQMALMLAKVDRSLVFVRGKCPEKDAT